MGVRCRVFPLVMCAVCLTVGAGADEPGDAARIRVAAQEFDAGRRAFQLGDYPTAAVHFQNADRDAPSVEALRLAIRARKEAGHNAKAGTLAQAALRRYPTDEATVTLARSVIAEVEKDLVKADVTCDPRCALVVDGKAFDDQAKALVIYLEPGKHSVAATWDGGKSREVAADGKAGQSVVLVLRPPAGQPVPVASSAPAPTMTAPPVAKSKGLSPVFFYTGLGVTAVLGGITVWSGLDTKNNPGTDVVEAKCVNRGESCPEYQDGLSRQKRTNILLGATIGMAAVTGVVAVFTNWGGSRPAQDTKAAQPKMQLLPTVGYGDGLQLGAVGRF